MKRLLALLLLAILLTGCTAVPARSPSITVSLMGCEGCRILDNGKTVSSGGDVVFELEIEDGYLFSSLDYDGEYGFETVGSHHYVYLRGVRYPARIQVRLLSNFSTVTYDPNGGTGQRQTMHYPRTYHLRPNTDTGTALFSREGYTLTGWNSQPDGSGTTVGLGSRVTVPEEGLTLYAQWMKWTAEEDFRWTATEEGILIQDYHGAQETVVIPASIAGQTVTAIAGGAFTGSQVSAVILPPTLQTLEAGAFQDCAIRELTLFDNIGSISDSCFLNCPQLQTLRVNAVDPPYGYNYRKESCLADKVDLLILAQGTPKAVFYGGCSMWFNLDSAMVQEALGSRYSVINMGLNGIMSSLAQMQIITAYLEEGDIFFHTPELSSQAQLMLGEGMTEYDHYLWSGLEYNYDLVSLLDLRDFPNFFDVLQSWLDTKEPTSSYLDTYQDSNGRLYMDAIGGIPFQRSMAGTNLTDTVYLDPAYIDDAAMERLCDCYGRITAKGAKVYLSYACVNLEAVPQDQQGNVALMDQLFKAAVERMNGPAVVSDLSGFLYQNSDFYDTNYHLLSGQASANTALWLRDLLAQMEADGLLK